MASGVSEGGGCESLQEAPPWNIKQCDINRLVLYTEVPYQFTFIKGFCCFNKF